MSNNIESPTVTVIVPVYNVEKYLKRCIESILRQKVSLELILVDDGSTDHSPQICDSYKAEQRVRVFHKDNEGAGYARNFGIDNAKGAYIFFIDSDDYLIDGCLERLLQVAKQCDSDFVRCTYITGKRQNYNKMPKKTEPKRVSRTYLYNSKGAIAIWGTLYSKELFNNVRYPKASLYDDEYVTYKLIYYANNPVMINEVYYYYFISKNSIMRTQKKKIPLGYIDAFKERIFFFDERNEREYAGISHKELAIRLMLSDLHAREYSDGLEARRKIRTLFIREYQKGKKYIFGLKEKLSLFTYYRFITAGRKEKITEGKYKV